MIVLDENFGLTQREMLRAWRIRFRHIGSDLLRQGADDSAVVPLLHNLPRPTFITGDRHFYDRDLRHHGYSIVYLDVEPDERASWTRRFLRDPRFRTHAQRLGAVIHVGHAGIRAWRLNREAEDVVDWLA